MLETLKVNNVMTVKHKTYVLFECPSFVANSKKKCFWQEQYLKVVIVIKNNSNFWR